MWFQILHIFFFIFKHKIFLASRKKLLHQILYNFSNLSFADQNFYRCYSSGFYIFLKNFLVKDNFKFQ